MFPTVYEIATPRTGQPGYMVAEEGVGEVHRKGSYLFQPSGGGGREGGVGEGIFFDGVGGVH